jgi:hypothetical protein
VLDEFKATMKLFGYTQFEVRDGGPYGFEVVVTEHRQDASGWPALWLVCDKLGISQGCGGRYYRQIKATLPVGVYNL